MKFSGIVKKNLGRGSKLGFPTANISAPKDLADGIYVGLMSFKVDGEALMTMEALIFIGAAETFGETDRKAEIYVLDLTEVLKPNDTLYDKEIIVETLKKLRDNKKFESEAALVDQMKQDEVEAREFFKPVI
jgi:riboflavin kinase/FMN adenylyltransferase